MALYYDQEQTPAAGSFPIDGASQYYDGTVYYYGEDKPEVVEQESPTGEEHACVYKVVKATKNMRVRRHPTITARSVHPPKSGKVGHLVRGSHKVEVPGELQTGGAQIYVRLEHHAGWLHTLHYKTGEVLLEPVEDLATGQCEAEDEPKAETKTTPQTQPEQPASERRGSLFGIF